MPGPSTTAARAQLRLSRRSRHRGGPDRNRAPAWLGRRQRGTRSCPRGHQVRGWPCGCSGETGPPERHRRDPGAGKRLEVVSPSDGSDSPCLTSCAMCSAVTPRTSVQSAIWTKMAPRMRPVRAPSRGISCRHAQSSSAASPRSQRAATCWRSCTRTASASAPSSFSSRFTDHRRTSETDADRGRLRAPFVRERFPFGDQDTQDLPR
jgi:hypothetical protein